MSWPVPLIPAGDGPMFQRIARAVVDDIRRGRLVADQRLPGSRALAGELGVHRNTVLAALAELEAQGWIVTRPARGTFVAAVSGDGVNFDNFRARKLSKLTPSPRIGFALPAAPPLEPRYSGEVPRGELHLSAGVPDPRLFPVDALARAWRRVVRRDGHKLLTYTSPEGHPPLRRAVAEMLRSIRGMSCVDQDVLITRGSQMAIDLVARGLLERGDRVAVEALGYRPSWDAMRLAGAELVPVPVDGGGLDVAALGRLAARRKLRAVYLTSHHQYPTTVTLGAARRLELAALARRHRLIILEDDYDHEFHYEGRPVPPLAAADDGGHVIYIGTLSKILAPGLRLGFLVAPPPVVARLGALRAAMDRQGDRPMEAAVAELIEDGELERHVRRMRTTYLARRDVLARHLRERLGGALSFDVPRGGISLWATVAPELDVAGWLDACAARGIHISPGSRYTFAGDNPGAFRIVFAPLTPAEIDRATAVMASTVRRRGRR